MEKKYINLALEALEITGSDELFQEIIRIGKYHDLIEAFSFLDDDFYILTLFTDSSIIELIWS